MSTKEPEPGFASRWSRLKQESREEQALEEEVSEPEVPAEDTRSDAEILEELGLPDPDALQPGDEIKGFMAKAVPTRLRNRALRKLWLSNPVLANLDELVEYGEDYTDAATVIENLQTAYQVGKGWADKLVETPKPLTANDDGAEDEGTDEEVTEVEPIVESPAEEPLDESLTLVADDPDPSGLLSPLEPPQDLAQEPVSEPQIASRKRMRFRVAED